MMLNERRIGLIALLVSIISNSAPPVVQAFTAVPLKAGRYSHHSFESISRFSRSSSLLRVAGGDVDIEGVAGVTSGISGISGDSVTSGISGITTIEDNDTAVSGWDNLEATKTVGLKRPVVVVEAVSTTTTNLLSPLVEQQRRNIAVAVVSVVLAIGNFFWQYSHPTTSVQLLFSMQQSSAPMTTIGVNGKPTVVDFWAPWCENCKLSAPTLQKVEQEYKDSVNFVMVNGDQSQAWPYIEAFGVDAIPHMALVSAEGDVMTALIGPTPKSVLEADLNVLLQNAKTKDDATKAPLPYVMMDVFANAPERRRVHFDE